MRWWDVWVVPETEKTYTMVLLDDGHGGEVHRADMGDSEAVRGRGFSRTTLMFYRAVSRLPYGSSSPIQDGVGRLSMVVYAFKCCTL